MKSPKIFQNQSKILISEISEVLCFLKILLVKVKNISGSMFRPGFKPSTQDFLLYLLIKKTFLILTVFRDNLLI